MAETLNIASYMDGPDLAKLVRDINAIPGSLVQNPRPDMIGIFVVTNIEHISVIEHSSGMFALVALMSVAPAPHEMTAKTAKIAASPLGENAALADILGGAPK